MKKEERMQQDDELEKNENNIDSNKIEEEDMSQAEIKQIVESLIEQNQRLLLEINNVSKNRKNKNIITPQMSLLTNKLERNLIRIARIVPPDTLADPEHVKQEKERFLKFYRGRNAPKKNPNSQTPVNGSNLTPPKPSKEYSKQSKRE